MSNLDKGEKVYRLPVLDEKGAKTYLPVSEQFLNTLIKTQSMKAVFVPHSQLEKAPERAPASLGL